MMSAAIPISSIETGARLRAVDPSQVGALVASIGDVGLLNPITVYPRKVVRGGVSVDGFGLVAGAHRLEAVRRLGRTEIAATVVDLGELERQIAECDENLCGTRLSPSERALFTRRRKEAYEALHPETKNGGDRRGPDRQVGELKEADRFTADTAARTGQSERAVQRDAERGDKVCAEAMALLAGTRFDTGVYLDMLKRLPPDEQVERIHLDLDMDREVGAAPRRANLRAAVGTASATAAERGNNLYETPPEAMKTLLSFCRFGRTVWEPACGKGAIARQLEDAGYAVELSDLVDYSTADRHGELQRVEDFLATAPRRDDPGRPDIVTNPPYGAALNAFVAHALAAHRPRRMALLLNLNFLCGFDDADRNYAMDDNPPARIYVFTRRLPMMHRDGWDGPEASSRMNTAWFVWELRGESYAGPTEILRVDWKVFENAVPVGPAESGRGAEATPSGPAGHPPREGEGGRQALAWVQPYENGRILAMSGGLEVGAIFPDGDKPTCRWAFFVDRFAGEHRNVRTVGAAKAALAKRWAEWLAKAGLGAAS